MAERRGMGRGLAAILPELTADSNSEELRQLSVDLVKPNPKQPRTTFDPEALEALAESVGANGVLQPLLVRPLPGGAYELIAGERRLRAARMAGLATVPAVVRSHLGAHMLEIALIENMARTDLNAVDEARACAALVEDLGLTKEDVARRVGRSRVAISNLIRLLNLPDDVLELIGRGDLSEGHGRAILRAPGNDVRRKLARRAVDEGWSVREAERQAEAAASGVPAASGPASVGAVHPDLEAARRETEDDFAAALGHDVTVRLGRGGSERNITVALKLDDLGAAAELARRLRNRA